MEARSTQHDALTAIKNFLLGTIPPTEVCCILSVLLREDAEILVKDKNLFAGVASEIDALPVGALKKNWHQDFIAPKLAELSSYDSLIFDQVTAACKRVIVIIENREAQGQK